MKLQHDSKLKLVLQQPEQSKTWCCLLTYDNRKGEREVTENREDSEREYKVEEKISHLYPEESGTSLGWKCKIENRVLTKQTDYWRIDLNADYLIESKWQFSL